MPGRKLCHINKDLLVYKSFYFFFYGALGTINPYLPVYFRQIGLSAVAVGLLVGIRPIIQFASAPFWTVMADKFKKRKPILVMSIIAWLLMTISLAFVEPTEEICQLTANNSTHHLFVNYTSFNTGFFKRSNEGSQGLHGLQITDEKELKTIPVTEKVGFPNPYTKNANNIAESLSHSNLTYKYERSANNSTYDSEQREKRIHFVKKIKKKDRYKEVDKSTQLPSISNYNHRNFSSETSNVISFRNKMVTRVKRQTNRTQSMKLPKSPIKNSQKSNKPIDVHYFNMNGPERKNTSISSEVEKRNITGIAMQKRRHNVTRNSITTSKNTTYNHTTELKMKLTQKNKTHTITQRNLFKTNTNEMKRHFIIVLILIVVGEFLETPAMPVSDASLLDYLGEDRIYYGKQRLWGSLGHGVSSFLVGTLLENSRHITCGEEFIDYTICFCAFTLFMLSNLITTANFKFTYNEVEEKTSSVFSTVLNVHYISFLCASSYMGMCHGFLHNFIMWFLEDLGGSKTLMGLAIGCRSSADLITFFVASLLIEKLGQIKIVLIALVSYGTIFVAYSSMTNPWFALAVEFLEGFTHAASWSACTSYLAEAAPRESVATMQGVLQGVYYGLGTGIGAIIGGHMIHTLGAYSTFRMTATASFIVASLFVITQWKWPREDLNESLGIYDYFSAGEPKDTEALLTNHEELRQKHTKKQRDRDKKHDSNSQ